MPTNRITDPDYISNILNLSVNGSSIAWVSSLSHLGIRIIASKKFKVDLTASRQKSFAVDNFIYSRCTRPMGSNVEQILWV